MHFSTSAALALLPAFGSATSYLRGSGSGTGNNGQSLYNHPHNPDNAGGNEGLNDCGVSTFTELTQPEGIAPTVDDCQEMLKQIVEDQEWIVDKLGETLVSYGTCAFNARVARDQPRGSVGYIGNGDVLDLVRDSIRKYETEDGNVGNSGGCHGGYTMFVNSAGGMPCDSPNLDNGTQVQVDWTLTHSGDLPNGGNNSPYHNPFGGNGGQGGVQHGGGSGYVPTDEPSPPAPIDNAQPGDAYYNDNFPAEQGPNTAYHNDAFPAEQPNSRLDRLASPDSAHPKRRVRKF